MLKVRSAISRYRGISHLELCTDSDLRCTYITLSRWVFPIIFCCFLSELEKDHSRPILPYSDLGAKVFEDVLLLPKTGSSER